MSDLINEFDSKYENEQSLRDSIVDIIENENVNVLPARQVRDAAVFEVADRALISSESLDPESQYFAVLREVASFVSLSIAGSHPNGTFAHTDLLPVGHPLSTARHGMSASAYRRERALWVAADPRIEDEHVRTVVASAYAANPLDPEFVFATTRLRALKSDQVPLDLVISPLLADFGSNPYAGRNSFIHRSARASAQRRDRKGRFAYEGGGARVYVAMPDGSTKSVVGSFAGNGLDPNRVELELKGVEGFKDGIYSVATANMEWVAAILPEHVVSNIVPKAPGIGTPTVPYKEMVRQALPSSWSSTGVAAILQGIINKVKADENLISADGYQVSLYKKMTPELRARIEEVAGKHNPKISGEGSAASLDATKPIYEVVSSMSGDNKVIGYAQDWNGIQNILAAEDEKFPDQVNQAPIATLPAEKVAELPEEVSTDEMSDDDMLASEAKADNLREQVPADWIEKETDNFYSPDGRTSVQIGEGYVGDESIAVEDENGNISYISEPIYMPNVFTIVDHEEDPIRPNVLGVGFNWPHVENMLSEIKRTTGAESIDRTPNPTDEMAEDMAEIVANGPSMSEKKFDQEVAKSGVDPTAVVKDILSPGFFSPEDKDPVATIKSILYPGSTISDTDEMAAPKEMASWLEPTKWHAKRSDASKPVSEGMFRAIKAAYYAHKHTLPMQAAVEEILTNPENHTMAEALSLLSRINLQAKLPLPEGYSVHPVKANPNQRKALQTIIRLREIDPDEKAALADRLNYLTQAEADREMKKYSDDAKYPFIKKEASSTYAEISKTAENAGPKNLRTNLTPEEGGPSDAQMVMMESLIENREIPEEEIDAFMEVHEDLTAEQYSGLISRFKDEEKYPFKEKYRSKTLRTELGDRGPTPRMLASLERKLAKGLISEFDLKNLPYMTRAKVGLLIAQLKEVEDTYDRNVLVESLSDYKINFLENPEKLAAAKVALAEAAELGTQELIDADPMGAFNMRVPDDHGLSEQLLAENGAKLIRYGKENTRHLVSQAWYDAYVANALKSTFESVNREDNGSTGDSQSTENSEIEQETVVALKEDARRRDARIMRKALMNAAGDLAIAMADRSMTVAGRSVLRNGISFLHALKSALDLRKGQYSVEEIDEALGTIRDLIAKPNEGPVGENFGRLRKVTPELEKTLAEASISVDRLIGTYQAGRRNSLAQTTDEMSDDVAGDMPENWKGSTGYYSDDSGRYSVMLNSSTGYALFDGKFNPMKPNKIAYVRSWKDVTDTIDYNETVRRLPDMEAMAQMYGMPDLDPESWRMGPLLDLEDEEAMYSSDELSDDAPSMGYIKAPAFYGPAFDNMPKKASYQEIAEYIQSNIPEYYVFDFETTGLPGLVTPNVKNDPVQIAISKVVNNEVVDSTSYYMNPESDLSDWSAENLTVEMGSPISKDWLAAQMSKRQAMEQFLKFVPQNAVLAGHNAGLFDMEILNRTMKSVGLPEYKAGGFIDTWGLASYVIPTPKNNPNNLPAEEIAKSHKLGDLVEFFNIPVTGMHNAKNDVEATAQLVGQILKFGNDGKAVGGADFDLTKSKNGFSFPRYKALAETYKTQASEWIARNAEELISMGYGTSVDDFVSFLSYPYNATGAKSGSAGSILDDAEGTGEGAGSTASLPAGRPTDKQVNSLMRRLMTRGLFPDDVFNMIVEEIPTLDRVSIGWWIKYADAAEVKFLMANNQPVESVRVPEGLQPEVSKYMAENFPPTSNTSDEMADEPVAKPQDKITVEDLQAIEVDWSLLPEGVILTEEGKNIVRAIIGGYDTMVQALAGTGKTFNIEMAIQLVSILRPGDRSAYLVFNNNIAEEARTKLPDSVEVRTSDSLSVNAEVNKDTLFGKMKAQNKNSKFRPVSLTNNSIGLLQYLQASVDRNLDDTAERTLELENMPFSRTMKAYEGIKNAQGDKVSSEKIVKAAGDAVALWVISGDEDISEKHFVDLEIPYQPELLDLANSLWGDIMTPLDEGRQQIQVEFSHLFKNWALTHPNLRQVNGYGKSKNGFKGKPPTIVFLDEAQDINEVFYQLLVEQGEGMHGNGLQIVAVGDSNQSLYEWRGAMNAIAKFQRDITLPLTQSYRSGKPITDYGNLFLDVKGEDDVRLVGSPNVESEVVKPNTMKDYTAIIVNTNLGALEAVAFTGVTRPNDTVGVVPAFKQDLDLFIKTARYLLNPDADNGKKSDDPLLQTRKKSISLLPDLASFKNWKELQDEYELHGSLSIGKYLNIIQTATQMVEGKSVWDGLAALEQLSGRLRVAAEGFVVPTKIGTEGELGNRLGYRIENNGKKIVIFNTGYGAYRAVEGTSNNKAVLKQHGFVVEGFEYVLEGKSNDTRKALTKLVDDLSGKNIDVTIITTHRSKGLEYDRVRIWKDFPGSFEPDIEGGATESQKDELQRSLDAQKDFAELNKAYTAVTRAKYALDPGPLSWITDPGKVDAMVKKMEKILAEGTREENEVKDGASGMVNADIQYDVSVDKKGAKITLNVKGSTTKYDQTLEALQYKVTAGGRNWILDIPAAEDAAQSLGFRMRAMDELKKRINRFKETTKD